MKVRLLSPSDDLLPTGDPDGADALAADLELDLIWDAMAAGDDVLRDVARRVLLRPVTDPAVIGYRQRAWADATRQRPQVEALYALATDALRAQRGVWMVPVHGHPDMELSWAVRMLGALCERIDKLRTLAAQAAPDFTSEAFRGLCAVIAAELDDDYLAELRGILKELSFPEGLLTSAAVGLGGVVTTPVLRRPKAENRHFFDRIPLAKPAYVFTLPPRDDSGARALGLLRDRSVNEIANAASQSVDHVLSFFQALRDETGFYLAVDNLVTALRGMQVPVCVPVPEERMVVEDLVDPALALRQRSAPVPSDVRLDDSRLLVVTGANRGGKSTLLRALGVAQLMMQAGMPVAARSFRARPAGAVFTHWAREEDTALVHGKLDEELERMAQIVAAIRPGDLLLCNESFASTNEAEGSQILGEVTLALVRAGVEVRAVTHLYDFASSMQEVGDVQAVFLRAPRADGGDRSFRLEPGPPLRTSFGLELYNRAFGTRFGSGADGAADAVTAAAGDDPVPVRKEDT